MSKTVHKLMVGDEARDDHLVERTLEGDSHAYQILVERYQQRLFAVVLGIMRHQEDALDVTQEAFVKAYKNLKSFRKQSSFYTWIYRIAYNLSIDEKRRKYRHVEDNLGEISELDRASASSSSGEEFLHGDRLSPEEALNKKEFAQMFSRALDKLSPEHRAVVILREVEGLSYTEISETVGCSKGTVMSRLHHARKKLQDLLRVVLDKQENEAKRVGQSEA